jgi:nitrogen fixation protein FixH
MDNLLEILFYAVFFAWGAYGLWSGLLSPEARKLNAEVAVDQEQKKKERKANWEKLVAEEREKRRVRLEKKAHRKRQTMITHD